MYSSGQAMVEFAVGLVVLMALLAGLIQIGRLAHAQTRTMFAARARAGMLAIGSAPPVSVPPALISDWFFGSDQRRHTQDDTALVTSNTAALPGELVGQAHLEWAPASATNALAVQGNSPSPSVNMFLVKGAASESVPILPIIRRLVYAREELEVESDVWLVWTAGIY